MQAFAGSIREQRDQVKLADESTAIHCAELKDYKVRASAREDQLLYQPCRRIHSGPGCSKAAHSGLQFQLNTFGFGYDLDSELLDGLARSALGPGGAPTSAATPTGFI